MSKFYALATFLGAFLLFQIEPMVGKALLPVFGGSSQVWSAAMLFFMLLLFLGYLYAFLLSKQSGLVQVVIHMVIVLAAVAAVAAGEILPSADSISPWQDWPETIQIITTLSYHIGIPFFLLSTTSIILQHWHGVSRPDKSPYKFYVASNLGSLFALVSYPLGFEPILRLETQSNIWQAAFFVFCAGLALVTLWYAKGRKSAEAQSSPSASGEPSEAAPRNRYGLWLGLSTLSSAMLLSVTNEITQGIAPVPFLWLVPLSLYLLSFIICFSELGIYVRPLYCLLFLFSSLFLLAGKSFGFPLATDIILYNVALFAVCMICHGELYATRPPARDLTIFYAIVSFGGVVGGVFVALLAPLIFNDFWEFMLSLLAAMIMSLAFLHFSLDRWFSRTQLGVLSAAMVSLFVILGGVLVDQQQTAVVSARNFYGALRVTKAETARGTEYHLINGKIIHGLQFMNEEKRRWPTTYYGETSGAGLAIMRHPKRQSGKPLRVGVVGLGAGTIAAYCEPEDYFQFYEINPDVAAVANERFKYLADCQGELRVTLGDARLEMKKELEEGNARQFDVLAVDAFVDDAIPVHLLTREAMEIYLAHLGSEDSILAMHISNRNLDLTPVLAGHARHFQLNGVSVSSGDNRERGTYGSSWVLLSRQALPVSGTPIQDGDKIRDWTDDFSNLFQVLRR